MQTVPTPSYHAQRTAWGHQHCDAPDLLAQDLEPARAWRSARLPAGNERPETSRGPGRRRAGARSERTLNEVRASRAQRHPDDLLGRLSEQLWVIAVRPSAERACLATCRTWFSPTSSSSPRASGGRCPEGAEGGGPPRHRVQKEPEGKHDPPSIHNQHFYEISVPRATPNLPMMPRPDPGNTSDITAGLLTLDRVQKTLRDQTDGPPHAPDDQAQPARCPKAPAEQPDWLCQPESKVGPVVNLATSDDLRLFPVIQRNSATYEESYSLRTGRELLSDEDARGTVRKLLTKAALALP